MKKTMVAGALAAALVLGGCLTATEITALINQAQTTAKAACSVVPTAESIYLLWASNNAAYATAAAIAEAICAAVDAAPASAKLTPHASKYGAIITPQPVTVNGVEIDFY